MEGNFIRFINGLKEVEEITKYLYFATGKTAICPKLPIIFMIEKLSTTKVQRGQLKCRNGLGFVVLAYSEMTRMEFQISMRKLIKEFNDSRK
jgi:hypothetical protein